MQNFFIFMAFNNIGIN